jgi:PAS domain S-box-containing protein
MGRLVMAVTVDAASLLSAIGDAVVVADESNNIVYWNPGAERMFGHSQGEAMGQSLDMIIPERLRARHGDAFRITMETGHTRYGTDVLRVPAVHKDGRMMSIAFTVAMQYSPEHKPTAVLAVIRDESARFQEDRLLRKRLAELEAQLAAKPHAG